MLTIYSGTFAAGTSTEISIEDFASLGPIAAAPNKRAKIGELAIKSLTTDISLRFGGTAGNATSGSLGRIVITTDEPAMLRRLDGAVIEYGAAKIRLGFSGRGDGAQTATAYNYEIDLVGKSLSDITLALATQLAALSGVGTATFNGASKMDGSIYIHDSAGVPTSIALTAPNASAGLIRVESPILLAWQPVTAAECPVSIELPVGVQAITINAVANSDGVLLARAT